VHASLTRPLDWFAIQLCRRTVHCAGGAAGQVERAERLVADADFFCDNTRPAELTFGGPRDFQFVSPLASGWPQNDRVSGRLFRCGQHWRTRPAVVLLHGWNAETGYRLFFPLLAWRLNRAGINAAMFELPFHGRRKPTGPGAVSNFLSDDLSHVAMAARQAIADARALVGWLAAQGCPRIGLWGMSLGAWLGGLLACVEPRVCAAALTTPLARPDRLVAEVEFCEPIRRALNGAAPRIERLNLAAHRPLAPVGDILIVESQHDMFAPADTIEELWAAWGWPEIWRAPHGHISVLMSVPVQERTLAWIARRMRGGPGGI
jgi:dienelactone hydrolase